MTTKTLLETISCKSEEAPKKSLEKAIELLQTNPEIQAAIKDRVVCGIHLTEDAHAVRVSLDFLDLDLVTGDPLTRLSNNLKALADLVAKRIKEKAEELEEGNND